MEVIQLDKHVQLMKLGIDSLDSSNIYKDALYLGLSQIQEFEKEKADRTDSSSIISFRLISNEYPSGSIDLQSLNDSTSLIQEALVNASSNIVGFSGSRGPIPQDIIERNRLIITSTQAGSFIVNLRPTLPDQINLLEEKYPSVEILEDLLGKLDGSSNIIEIAEKYGIRTWNAIKKWSKSLEKNNIEFEFHNKLENKHITFYKDNIHDINIAFRDNTVKEEFSKETITGILTKIDVHNKEIEITDTTKNESIKIFIKDNSLKSARLISNIKYAIDLEIQTYYYNNTKKTIRYIAESVKNMQEV
jgi:hypothetical protein